MLIAFLNKTFPFFCASLCNGRSLLESGRWLKIAVGLLFGGVIKMSDSQYSMYIPKWQSLFKPSYPIYLQGEYCNYGTEKNKELRRRVLKWFQNIYSWLFFFSYFLAQAGQINSDNNINAHFLCFLLLSLWLTPPDFPSLEGSISTVTKETVTLFQLLRSILIIELMLPASFV